MKVIAGLGNPGARHAGTRHNVGYMVVDELARRWNVRLDRYEPRFEALLGECQAGEQCVLLLKPQTYMNLSGRSLLAVRDFYKLAHADLLIVCDDLDLPTGRIRLRAGGSGGGQRGLENILLRLAGNDIPRLRIGIGKVPRSLTVDYVLSRFSPDEQVQIERVLVTAADAVECWLNEGIEAAMNRFNRREKRASGADGSANGSPEGDAS